MPHSKTAAVALVIVFVNIAEVLGMISMDSQCNVTKGCFYECIDPSDCSFMTSWVDSADNVTFTLRTMTEDTNFWMALGFSDDRNMGNDSVTGCSYKNGVITVFNAKTESDVTPQILSSEGIFLSASSYENGLFTCTFDRVKAASTDRFDLNLPWHLLFARGPLNRKLELGYHGDNRFSSAEKYVATFQPKPTEVTTAGPTQTPEVTTSVSSQPTDATTSVPSQPTEATTSVPPKPAVVTTSVPTQPTEVTTLNPSSHAVSKVKGCGSIVGCYSDCVDLTCSFIISWNTDGNNSVYTVTSNVARESGVWVAIGFSHDSLMGDDDVMGCLADTSGQVVAITALNTKYDSPNVYTDAEIKLTAYSTEDGQLSCTFLRPIAGSESGRVNVSEPWTLLFAKGPGKITNAGEASMSYHGPDFYVSTLPTKVSDLVDLGAVHTEYPLVKAHGSLMIGAWVFLASVGIVVARYYKLALKRQLCSGNVWFQIHRICMVLVFCTTAAGFIIIFIEVDGYSKIKEDKKFLQGHPIIGIIVMILTVLNPAMALIRPHPGTPKRPIFNWAHWFVGTSAHILGVVNVFFGFLLTKANIPYYLLYIMAAYVAWQIFVEVLLEAITCFGRRLSSNETNELDATKELSVESSETILAKRFILIVHCFIVASFAVVLIVLLDLGNKKLA